MSVSPTWNGTATTSVGTNYRIGGGYAFVSGETTAVFVFDTPPTAPGSYKYEISKDSFATIAKTETNTTGIFDVTGLTPGTNYLIRCRCYSGTSGTGSYGVYIQMEFSTPGQAPVASVTSTPSGVSTPQESTALQTTTGTSYAASGNNQVSRSLFKITNNSKDKNKYSLAERDTGISTGYQYFSFGTGMFFQSTVSDVEASGGIGFFVSGNGMTGYYVLMQTTSNLSSTSDKEVKIIKMVGGEKIMLTDSQKGDGQKLTGILGGTSYKVDIKVQVTEVATVIDVYINNFKITAVDTAVPSSTKPKDNPLPRTSRIAMFAGNGSAYFDYVYALPLDKEQFDSGLMQNIYNGQYGSTVLNFLYGEKLISGLNKAEVKNGYLEEFGTVARELRKVNIKFDSRPGYPLYPSLGINKFVNVLGSRLTSFGAEVYIVNNAGTYVPLDDSNLHSFSIVGNYVVQSGEHEYTDSTINQYSNPEPVVFESAWIQTENDAKSLSTWIKNQWSKQQQVVSLEVFGNPLISVGDVIAINYPKNDLDGTKKFVVTNVNTSFNQGLETSITARSIAS